MDADRFDTLARSLSNRGSRRRALALAAVLGGALTPLLTQQNATAHDRLKKCKKIDDKKKKKACVKKAKKHNATHAIAAPTCSDGIRNGTETDIDCGGTCPRCANGKVCVNRNDCASAFCKTGTCQPCTSSPECSTDANGECFCTGATAEANRCESRRQVASCDECPEGTTSCGVPGGGIALCNRICGT